MKYSDLTILEISNLISEQFPSIYRDHGQNLIAFIRAYYEWLENENDGVVYGIRTLYDNLNINTAPDQFLEHFRKKFMANLPPELLGNQRLLQKHIIELYRMKGSNEAIRLLFRLLFNEEIDFYVPSYDIFKLSDNTWVQPRYFELTTVQNLQAYVGMQLTGEISGATCILESVESKNANGYVAELAFITNVAGKFIVNEKLLANGLPVADSPTILGSIVALNVTTSMSGFSVGDEIIASVGEIPVRGVVSSTRDATGTITFTVNDGGTYYSLDADVSITPGSNTQGVGAEFIIQTLKNTFQYEFSTDPLATYANVDLDALNYGFPALPTTNADTILQDAMTMSSVTVGTIDRIQQIGPGAGYDGDVTITVTDPYTSTSGIFDAKGVHVGTNAVITGVPAVGERLAERVEISASGFNMREYTNLPFYKADDPSFLLSGAPEFGGIGQSEGYYDNTKSFLSDDKYLFDGHYYQDFSYVVRSSKMLNKYLEVLRAVAHPSGNAVYGDIRITVENELDHDIAEIKIVSKAV